MRIVHQSLCMMGVWLFEWMGGEPPFDMVDAADHLEALGKGTVERGPLLPVKRQGWRFWNETELHDYAQYILV